MSSSRFKVDGSFDRPVGPGFGHIMKKYSHDPVILKGLVVPAQWDKNGKIVGLAIACSDEKEYPVMMDNMGRNLMTHMHDVVRITGKPVKMDNLELIQVKRFAKIARLL